MNSPGPVDLCYLSSNTRLMEKLKTQVRSPCDNIMMMCDVHAASVS